jgi:hypothetical protein
MTLSRILQSKKIHRLPLRQCKRHRPPPMWVPSPSTEVPYQHRPAVLDSDGVRKAGPGASSSSIPPRDAARVGRPSLQGSTALKSIVISTGPDPGRRATLSPPDVKLLPRRPAYTMPAAGAVENYRLRLL